MIATILKALRQPIKENDQLNVVEEISGPVSEISIADARILRDGRGYWDDVNGGHLPEDLVWAARGEEMSWVHSGGFYEIVPMQECTEVGEKLLDLIWVDTDKSVDPAHRKVRSRHCVMEYKTKKQGTIHRALFASQLFSATS